MTTDISSSADILDVRAVIERFEELESDLEIAYESDAAEDKPEQAEWIAGLVTERNEDATEFLMLQSLLDDLAGNGGDEQWRGEWYPLRLIADSYFETYAWEFADDIGAINQNAGWPNTCIDWEQAARELQSDYSSVEYDGSTFWYR